MTGTWIVRARQVLQVLGAALCAALGLRVMVDAIGEARAARALAPVAPEKPPLLELADELIGSAPAPAPEPEPVLAAPGKSLRLFLSVVVGPERSEIFVNGTRLGLSPYVGDFTCKEGENLSIEVVPQRGPLMTRQAKCAGQTVLIRD